MLRQLGRLLWLTLLGSSLLLTQGQAASYYAAATGSDGSANCTEGSPCLSLNRLVEVKMTSAGDIGLLRCGDRFRETSTVVAAASGTSGSPMQLMPYGSCYRAQGLHAGSNNSANLVVPGTNFVTVGVSVGDTVYNRTDASHANVTSITTTSTTNDTLVLGMGLAQGAENLWDVGDRYDIDNYPIVTGASLFDSGWTEVDTNVWRHAATMHPARHVWINGWSPNSSHHSGTCSTSGMASASDRQWCTTASFVYIKSTSNPATRWTAPGVEVVHLFNNQSVLLSLGSRARWTMTNISTEKMYGLEITGSGATNIIVDGGKHGWSQRHNCTSNCWSGNSYSWLSGEDNRGGGCIQFGGSGTYGPITLRNLLIHDCDNNGTHLGGIGNATNITYQNVEMVNTFHGGFNLGSSSSSAGQRTNVLFDRVYVHDSCTNLHTGSTGPTFSNLIIRDSVWREGISAGDARIFAPAEGCGSGASAIFIDDPGTYTLERTVVDGWSTGIVANKGTMTVRDSAITDNSTAGINARSTARVTLLNTIIADNGTGSVDASDFQVGCTANCTSTNLFSSSSNTNKFRQPGGGAFGYLAGVDTSMTLGEWQSRFGGNASSVTTASCFVDATNRDWNLADGCDDIAALRGPFREITLTAAPASAINGTLLTGVWSVSGTSPLSACTASRATVEYTNVPQTVTACTANLPLSNTTTMTIATAPAAGATVELRGTYGLVEDSQLLGNVYNAKSRAFSDTAIDNAGTVVTTGWTAGTNRIIPSGTDRLFVVFGCWEKNAPSATPLDFTGCTYGGQAMTKIADANVEDLGLPSEVLATAWYLKEAGIAAATDTLIACTPDEAEAAGRPKIILSGVYDGINQTSPVLSSQTATHQTAASLSTAALASTSNPGVAVTLACSGNNGAWTAGSGWTEQADVCEDEACGTRAHVSDRATTGDTPAGAADFATSEQFSTRLAMVAFALNGGADLPPEPPSVVTRTVTATRCALPVNNTPEPFPTWQHPQNTGCEVTTGFGLILVSEYHVSGADEPTTVGKRLQCCSDGVCDEDADYFAVDDAGTNGVKYTGTLTTLAHGTTLGARLLSGAACTYVAGGLATNNSMPLSQLDEGECSNVAHAITVTLQGPATLKCRLALDNNSPLIYSAGAELTITVDATGRASGI